MPDLPRTLSGRGGECATLDGLLEGVRGGRSGALVVRGEAGAGKTALLRYAIESAVGLRVIRAVGGRVGDGTCVRRAAPAVRAVARSPRAPAWPAARRAGDRLRAGRGPGTRPFPGRPGGAEPAVRSGRGTPAAVRGRRRPMAGPGISADAHLRRAAAAGRVGADGVRGPGTGRGLPGACLSWWSAVCVMRTPVNSWRRWCAGRWTSGSRSGSWLRHEGIRWRCWNCRVACR